MFGAIGVLAALQQRQTTGRGSHISASLFETSVFLVGQHMAQFAVTGTPAAPMPARISAWAVYDVFEVQDGEKVFVGVVSDIQWGKFCNAFGLTDWANDESLAANNNRVERRDEIMPVLRELFGKMSKSDLMAKLEKTGLPFAPINKPEDLFDDPHLNESDGLLDMVLPDGQEVALPALPISVDFQRLGLQMPPPRIGEHSEDILSQMGKSNTEIAQLCEDGVIAKPG